MSLPADLHAQIIAALHSDGDPSQIVRYERIQAGFALEMLRLHTAKARYALKWSDHALPGAIAAEARGLLLLSQAIRTPRLIACADPSASEPLATLIGQPAQAQTPYAFLLIEWLDAASAPIDMAALGTQLAAVHRHSAPAYGLDHNNYIGSTPQDNGWNSDWLEFFAEQRLRPQLALALDKGLMPTRRRTGLEQIIGRLGELLGDAERQPALLHGDLWGGNVLAADAQGSPALIDPAVYYGDREADLAFTELFGGFSAPFYQAYHAAFPLSPGYAERRDIYNLYHLLNHLNLFGEGYGSAIDQILRRYGAV